MTFNPVLNGFDYGYVKCCTQKGFEQNIGRKLKDETYFLRIKIGDLNVTTLESILFMRYEVVRIVSFIRYFGMCMVNIRALTTSNM